MVSFRGMLASTAAVVAVAGLTVAGAAPATADTVTVNYTCGQRPWFVHQRTFSVEITAPATAARGTTVTLEARLTDTVPSSMDVAAERAIFDIEVEGASAGRLRTTGLHNPFIPAGSPFRLEDGRAEVTLNNPGEVTFRPYEWHRINAQGQLYYVCRMRGNEPAPVAATIRVF